jgi:hypothetical protein
VATWIERQWRTAKRVSGRAVDAVVDVGLPASGAYIGGALGTLCGPFAGACVPAGAALGGYLGNRFAPSAKSKIKKTGKAAEDWLSWEGAGEPPERPANLPTEIVGSYGPSSVRGEFDDEAGVDWSSLALVAAALGVATYASWQIRRG